MKSKDGTVIIVAQDRLAFRDEKNNDIFIERGGEYPVSPDKASELIGLHLATMKPVEKTAEKADVTSEKEK